MLKAICSVPQIGTNTLMSMRNKIKNHIALKDFNKESKETWLKAIKMSNKMNNMPMMKKVDEKLYKGMNIATIRRMRDMIFCLGSSL